MDKVDILNRDAFIDQLLKLTENLSANKSSTCFAINGVWGSGKTFVLDMFQEQLELIQSEETYTDKYFVIRYNCWEFDYYEEPLVAIVSSIMPIIEEKTKLFPDSETKSKLLGILKAAGVTLLSMGSNAFKQKIGIDLQKTYDIIRTGGKEGADAYEKDHSYDVYFGFKKVIESLTEVLQSIAEEYTIVFLVDELDRCIPEYAIKVLERLHHLTENKSNIITIISIDKKQLLSSVKQIFGFENPEKYLEKFINFEVKLDYGIVSETITEKYADYIALFDKDIFPFTESIEQYMQAIFKDIDIRSQEQIVNKSMLVHRLLYTDKKDYSFMCMELLIAVMIDVYHDDSCFSNSPVDTTSFDTIFRVRSKSVRPAFSDFFKEKFENIQFKVIHDFPDQPTAYILPEQSSLYGVIMYNWYWMHKPSSSDIFQISRRSIYDSIAENYKELMKFAQAIKIMI